MDKIKIYLPKKTMDIIEKDTEAFEFFKKDGMSLNKNALLTALVLNYGEAYVRERQKFASIARSALKGSDVSEEDIDALCERIAEAAYSRGDGGKFGAIAALKPTKQSEGAIEYIENYLLAGRSLSEYFRAMITSYASLPQDRREAIIFKPQYEAVLRAIERKKRIFVTTIRSGEKGFEFSPYAIASSKEELHLYVIGARGAVTTVRLSRISGVKLLDAEAQFTKNQIKTAEKMIKYGPQFYYGANETETCVKLTERGMEKYKKIYVHRPIPDRHEGNLMWFNCPHIQLEQYFIRFGADAEVLYPEKVRNEMHSFHSAAARVYEKQPRTYFIN